MSRASEQISKANATSQGRTDANIANDALHLGGIAAEEYATKKYVQDYHDKKESALKQYIDQQDANILNQAKEYANSEIRNQDFSSFAKVTDVQALDKKLTEDITEGLTAQKNYTDQITQQIVEDTNANFQDVENAIGSLNNNVNDLFQSVSNGKSKIAGAITDKGVPTSASDSFNTMANNISQIKTSGGTPIIPEGYYDTSNATVTAEDIRSGKLAYGKEGALIGTLNPSSGIDTSDATATAEDIVYGKTAYARGQLLLGTLKKTEIEEIYGVSTTEPYTISKSSYATTTPPDGAKAIYSKDIICFSKDGNYSVAVVKVEKEGQSDVYDTYIESLGVNDNGLYYQESVGGDGQANYKKI